MDSEPKGVICEQWLHVVCLPFNIKATKGKEAYLEKVAQTLEGSHWKAGESPAKTQGSDQWHEFRRYQSNAYFHPFVRRFLHNEQRIQRFYRDDVKLIKIDLDSKLTGEFTVSAKVERCELSLFQPDTGLLLLEISGQPLSLQQMQLLQDTFRRLYPPYLDCFSAGASTTWFGGHCPVQVTLLDEHGTSIGSPGLFRGDSPAFMDSYQQILCAKGADTGPRYPLAEHWRSLLEPFDCTDKGSKDFSIEHLGDDRAPILSWLALDKLSNVNDGNWIRTCFADSPGKDEFPYATKYLGAFDEDYCYDRYWYQAGDKSSYQPSRIMNCGYVFSYVGSSQDTAFFTNECNGAHAIFRHIYVEMGLIAHFQKAKLLSFSQRLSEMVSRKENKVELPTQVEVREFYHDFVEFTQSFWFDEISPQQQGIELFQMWRKQLQIQQLYDEVRQELKDLVEYTELRSAERLNHNVAWIGCIALIVALLSLAAGIFGMNDPDQMKKWLFPTGDLVFLEGPLQLWLAQISLVFAVIALLRMGYVGVRDFMSSRRKTSR